MAARHTAPLVRWNVGSAVWSIAVSHDGTRVASGSVDGLVRVWDVHTGALVLGPLRGHTDVVRSVAWSHDDTRLVSGSKDKAIQIWDALTGVPMAELFRGHTALVWSVAFSHDSSRIVSGSTDKTIRIWDAHAGVPTGKPLRGHTGPVVSVSFSPDNSRIISGSDDHTIRIWNAHTGSLIGKPLEGHTGWILSVAFSHDSTRIVSGSLDTTIRIWGARTGALVGEPLRRHTYSVCSVAFSPDSTRIFSGSYDGTICVWEALPSTPLFDMVTSDMSVEDMLGCLVQHGCADLSPLLDSAQLSLTPIANGGFGDVWRVTLGDGSVIAVKTLRLPKLLAGNAKGAKRAVREVHHWSKLRHPNVQELLGILVFRGGLGMASPWMENGHLKAYLSQRPEVLRHPLCIQLATGVTYLHSVEMVHGDLKAASTQYIHITCDYFSTVNLPDIFFTQINVLVSDDGILKINDFDYAVLSDSTLRFSATTRQGGGTLRWMVPELFRPEEGNGEGGESTVSRTKETDIYALGMTMLEIISDNVPYAEYRSDMGIYRAIYKQKPPKQPKQVLLPESQLAPVWDLLVKCWDHDPSARPDAASVLDLLDNMAL